MPQTVSSVKEKGIRGSTFGTKLLNRITSSDLSDLFNFTAVLVKLCGKHMAGVIESN